MLLMPGFAVIAAIGLILPNPASGQIIADFSGGGSTASPVTNQVDAWTGMAGMSNVGGEGQVIVGAIAAGGTALATDQFLPGEVVIVLMILATLASKGNPARMLLYFAICGIVAQLIGMFTTGMTSVIAFIDIPLAPGC